MSVFEYKTTYSCGSYSMESCVVQHEGVMRLQSKDQRVIWSENQSKRCDHLYLHGVVDSTMTHKQLDTWILTLYSEMIEAAQKVYTVQRHGEQTSRSRNRHNESSRSRNHMNWTDSKQNIPPSPLPVEWKQVGPPAPIAVPLPFKHHKYSLIQSILQPNQATLVFERNDNNEFRLNCSQSTGRAIHFSNVLRDDQWLSKEQRRATKELDLPSMFPEPGTYVLKMIKNDLHLIQGPLKYRELYLELMDMVAILNLPNDVSWFAHVTSEAVLSTVPEEKYSLPVPSQLTNSITTYLLDLKNKIYYQQTILDEEDWKASPSVFQFLVQDTQAKAYPLVMDERQPKFKTRFAEDVVDNEMSFKDQLNHILVTIQSIPESAAAASEMMSTQAELISFIQTLEPTAIVSAVGKLYDAVQYVGPASSLTRHVLTFMHFLKQPSLLHHALENESYRRKFTKLLIDTDECIVEDKAVRDNLIY